MSVPVPPGRGRWRLTASARQFAPGRPRPVVAQLTGAYGRRLEKPWSAAASLTFTLDGRAPEAAAIRELITDVRAYRWDEYYGEREMFRGIVAHGEDQLTEEAHAVTFVAYDYVKMLERRQLPTALRFDQVAQDRIATTLVEAAKNTSAADGTSLFPGSYLPLALDYVAPDGSPRPGPDDPSQPLRDRSYLPSQQVGLALDQLSKVSGGFDYDVAPGGGGPGGGEDRLRIFYPYQGINRVHPRLVYGSTISSLTRTVTSDSYANYVWVVGGSSAPDVADAPPLFSELWNTDANDVTRVPVGLWQMADNAPDVTNQSTLDQKVAGDLALQGILVPSYTMAMRPGAYTYGSPGVGDVCSLVIRSGRLDVGTTVRVLGIQYAIGDDGSEDVTLTVGRPPPSFVQLLTQADQDVDALSRR